MAPIHLAITLMVKLSARCLRLPSPHCSPGPEPDSSNDAWTTDDSLPSPTGLLKPSSIPASCCRFSGCSYILPICWCSCCCCCCCCCCCPCCCPCCCCCCCPCCCCCCCSCCNWRIRGCMRMNWKWRCDRDLCGVLRVLRPLMGAELLSLMAPSGTTEMGRD